MTLAELGNAVAHRYGADWALRFMGYIKYDPDGCWLWLGGRAGATDRPCVRDPYLRQSVYVARLVLMLSLDRRLRKGKLAGHTCDNKLCVNPSHLEEVTHSRNLSDAYKRCRRVPKPITYAEA